MSKFTEISTPSGPVRRLQRMVTMPDGGLVSASVYSIRRARKPGKAAVPPGPDVLLLPDLFTTMRSMEPLALDLMARDGGPARAVTFDARGRGLSDAPNDATPQSTASDLVTVCDAFGLHHVDAVATGTGLLGLLAAAPMRPSLVRRLVIGDAAPQFDSVGLARLAALRKRVSEPSNWAQATEMTKASWPGAFEALNEEDWERRARAMWREGDKGKIVHETSGGDALDLDAKQPEMWLEFNVLKTIPALLIRGETSPMLSDEIVERMTSVHQDLTVMTASGQGHVPSLDVGALPNAIAGFFGS